MIEKLGAMVVQGNDEDRFWVLVNYVIENRRKINELVDQRKKDKENRDNQIYNLQKKITFQDQEVRSIRKELMEYHNLLMKQKSGLEKFNDLLDEVKSLYEYVVEELKNMKKE